MASREKKGKKAVSSFPRRHRDNSYSLYRLISSVGIIVILGLLVVIGTQYIRYYQTRQELAAYEIRIAEYEARQETMEAEIERLQNLDYIEILARNRLGLVKPGEVVFQLED